MKRFKFITAKGTACRCLIVTLAIAWAMIPALSNAQQPMDKKEQVTNIFKSGSKPGWLKIRDEVNIDPAQIFTDYHGTFGLSKDDEMKFMKKHTDQIGMTHDRYQQYFKGKKIHGAQFIVHSRSGRVSTLNGRMITGMNQADQFTVNRDAAFEIAKKDCGDVVFLWDDPDEERAYQERVKNTSATLYPQGELVWMSKPGTDPLLAQNYQLCWQFDMWTKGGGSKSVFVQAITGEVLYEIPLSISCDGGTGNTTWYGSKSISTNVSGSNYILQDDCTGSHDAEMRTKNANGGSSTATAVEYEDGDNSWTSSSDEDGVTTHWCVHKTLDYYSSIHGRNSFDDAGTDIYAYNNWVFSFGSTDNACWDCAPNAMVFGDGSSGSSDDWNTIDIVGHEFTHGVTENSADLVYADESGALNESFSDIFGTMVEYHSAAGTFDWFCGEDRGSPIRDLSNPNAYGDPDTYEGTNWSSTGAVHTNSGVQNFWFYLLSEGGSGTNDNGDTYSVSGIGKTEAELIAYRNLTEYLISSSDYNAAREGSIQAAEDLYGNCSDEVIQTGNAWYAVGVGLSESYYDVTECGTIFFGSDITINGVNSVTAAGGGCTNTIGSTAHSMTYQSANLVLLKDGFTAPEGCQFYAVIDPCNISYYELKTSSGGDGIDAEIHDHYDIAPANVNSADQQIKIAASPNPFTDNLNISISFPANMEASAALYDLTGRKVRDIIENSSVPKGIFSYKLDGTQLQPGSYFLKVETPGAVQVIKVIRVEIR